MAAPNLRVVRRPRGAAVVASASAVGLTAAAAPVEDTAAIFKGVGGRQGDWQKEAWEHYRAVGECAFYVRLRANSCSRVRLVASELDPDTGEPTGSIGEGNREGARVAELVRGIAGGVLGQADLVKRMSQVLSVQGEVWVAVLQLDVGERWFALTRKEMRQGTRRNSVVIKLPDGSEHDFSPPADGLFRVWDPDAEDASQASSPIRANLESLREIRQATAKIRNADLSRLMGNGILAVPSEASLPASGGPVSADKPGGGVGGSPPVAHELTRLIVDQATVAVREGESSMASLVPLVLSVPGDHVDKIRHIEFSDQVTAVALQTRNDAIARFAMGVDMAPEQLLGLGSSNHWNAFITGDQDVQLHVSPLMQLICQGLYEHAVGPVLAGLGVDPSRYTLWFDTSRLTADPDLTDEAKDAFEKGVISAESLVRIYGLPDEAMYDFSSLEGWRSWAQDKVSADPSLLGSLLPLLDASVQGLEFPAAPALPPAGGAGDDDVEVGGEPDSEGRVGDAGDDEGAVTASAAGGVGMRMALEMLVTRALELSGKRRVRTNDAAQRQRLRGVDPRDYHRVMGPVAAEQVAGLIKGWDAGLDELAARYGFDPHAVRLVVEERVRRQLSAQVVDG